MRVIPGNAQHIGDRETQEDAFGFGSFGDRVFESHGGVMMVLCDGMGGLANGAAASRAAVDAVLSGYYRKQPSEDIASALDRALREAHQAVCAIVTDGGTAGTTIVVAVVWRDRLYWASLGDSRLYLCREGASAIQLTEDHNVASLLEQRAARGEGSVRDAASATNRDALTAYLGSPYPPQPHMGRDGLPLRPGDRIVACSDGLYRGLSPELMAAIASHGAPMTSAEHMIGAVLDQRLPGQDNLTVIMLEVTSRRRLIDIIGVPSPAVRGALYGMVGGFAAAVVLAGILIGSGVLTFSTADRHTVDTVPSFPAPSGNSAPEGDSQPSPTAGGAQSTEAPSSQPMTKLTPSGEGEKHTKGQPNPKSRRPTSNGGPQ